MPPPNKGEKRESFISRCMSSEEAKRTFPDNRQRAAFCYSQWERKTKGNRLSKSIHRITESPKPPEKQTGKKRKKRRRRKRG